MQKLLPLGIVAPAILFLLAVGVFGVGRSSELAADSRFYYVAAKCWLNQINPYDLAAFNGMAESFGMTSLLSYAYPPQSFAFDYLLALFPLQLLPYVMTVITLASLVAILIWCKRNFFIPHNWTPIQQAFAMAVIIGNPFTTHAIWIGNISILMLALTLWSWSLIYQNKWLIGGILLGIATTKPQICLLPILWLLLDRQWRALCVGGAVALMAAFVPMLISGPVESYLAWIQSMNNYADEPISSYGFEYIIGIKSFLAAIGFRVNAIPAGIIGLIILYFYRKKLSDVEQLSLVMSITLLFVYAHDYDLIMLIPAFLVLWAKSETLSLKLASLALLLSLCVPIRLVRILDVHPAILHWRTLVVLVSVLLLLALLTRSSTRNNNLETSS